jgi:hypothetical protein
MSLAGMVEAKKRALLLPRFECAIEARQALYAERDLLLAKLLATSKNSLRFVADYTPQSLKHLERWYFELANADHFRQLGIARIEFERGTSFYLGEVFVRHGRGFEWFVDEYWLDAKRYEIGVQRPRFALVLGQARSFSKLNNVRMQSLWREFNRYAP